MIIVIVGRSRSFLHCQQSTVCMLSAHSYYQLSALSDTIFGVYCAQQQIATRTLSHHLFRSFSLTFLFPAFFLCFLLPPSFSLSLSCWLSPPSSVYQFVLCFYIDRKNYTSESQMTSSTTDRMGRSMYVVAHQNVPRLAVSIFYPKMYNIYAFTLRLDAQESCNRSSIFIYNKNIVHHFWLCSC